MTSPSKLPSTVAELLRRRLREVNHSSKQLAEAVEVPTGYIDDLIAGARRPPAPERTDIYEKMRWFLRLGRNDLVGCARSELAETARTVFTTKAGVRRALLELCVPDTARRLERRRGRRAAAELVGFLQRLLDVTQTAVRRLLDDQVSMRLAASARRTTYPELRLEVLEFLDTRADTLTTEHVTEYVRPRIARWDVNLETQVLSVAMRPQEPRGRRRASTSPRSDDERGDALPDAHSTGGY